MPADITIDGRAIGPGHAPYCIAEISANHNGQLSRVFELIDAAADIGAHAAKIQTYRPDTITLDSDLPDFQITEGLWKDRTLFDLYGEAHTPWDWHADIFAHAARRGITLFSSPFDFTAIDLLEDLGAPAYKIASFEVIDLPLIRHAARTGKPMIISTGMANDVEIAEALDAARSAGCTELALLHCVSAYPAAPEDYNLATIPDMAARFDVLTGLSDHTIGNETAIAATALGACVIEKHFTFDRNGGGPDDSFSLEPPEFRALVEGTAIAHAALGKVDYGLKSSEQGNIKFRRSLYFVRDLKAGETITANAIRSVRPGYGIPPKHADEIIGKTVTRDVAANTSVQWDALT